MKTVTNFMRSSLGRDLATEHVKRSGLPPVNDNYKIPNDLLDEEECHCKQCRGELL